MDAEFDGVAAGEARQLGQRARRDDGLELRRGRVELGLLDREPVRVGGDHDELPRLEADEDPGQHRPRLVAGGGARDTVDGLEQRLAVDRVQLGVDGRQPWEVLGVEDVQARAVRAGDDLHRALLGPVLDRDVALGEQARELDERLARDDDGAVAFDLGVERRPQRQLHVGGGEGQHVAVGAEKDPGEHLDGAAGRDGTGDDAELGDELVAGDADLHPRSGGHLRHRLIFRHIVAEAGSRRLCLHSSLNPLVEVIGSVDDGEDGAIRLPERVCAVEGTRGENAGFNRAERVSASSHRNHPACLIRAVSSCTRLYTERSSRIIPSIFAFACITVVWSRPPNSLPIFGSDESVSARERYIATWRG